MTTTTLKRTDIHRPSEINPEDYYFVALGYQRCEGMGDVYAIQYERKRLMDHMARTGGKYSNHEHGGNCCVCGAHCLYTAIFYHQKTNTYIHTGLDCAAKLEMGDARAFKTFRAAVKEALEAKAGKAKAEMVLKEAGLEKAWAVYNSDDNGKQETIIRDIVGKLVRYGNISEKQEKFLGSLLHQMENRGEMEAKWAAEKEAAKEVPEGRMEVTATVIKTEYRDTSFGEQLKMLVKAEDGYMLWGTVPASLQLLEGEEAQRGLEKGDKITFTGTLKRSDRDPKFGFISRPAKARLAD